MTDPICTRFHAIWQRTESPQIGLFWIGHGCLYALVSYPNSLCEWAEWAGFALAAAPLPVAVALAARSWTGLGGMSPPWIFLLAEVVLMAPRALKGHAWYRRRFADYPRERRAVVPWVL
ncbi:hypothetical protein FIBSPDRAFT_960264 [Athelia psychrophila]|uniref:3-oxo-5-alpha-steroid 4-dehydrogenase C-terminal domain-containing protein n=1 Tax=Athelia psychrophila TaxID=1759441 RepID=A0A166CIY0_9AGAM|nr:hypothetical protein FIBSPDRAFT_960264 [Fibularhizoctonia sp. CBS 109695]